MCLLTCMSQWRLPPPHYSCRSISEDMKINVPATRRCPTSPTFPIPLYSTHSTFTPECVWASFHMGRESRTKEAWCVIDSGWTVFIYSLISGLLPREPPAGSGSEAHHPPAACTLWHPLQVQQGWVQDEGAGAYSQQRFHYGAHWNVCRCVIVSGVSVAGDHAELSDWAALLHRPLSADPGTRGNAGVLPREVDLSPHCM